MLCFVCVSKLGGEPFVNKCLFIVYEQFSEVRYRHLSHMGVWGGFGCNGLERGTQSCVESCTRFGDGPCKKSLPGECKNYFL